MDACNPLPMAKKFSKSARTKAKQQRDPDDDRRVYEPLPSLKQWFKLARVRAWQVAEAIGIEQTTLSNIGRGKRPYKRAHLEDMARFISKRLGRTVSPSMLLAPPADPELAVLAADVDPRYKERAASALGAFRREPQQPH